jgi:NAD(P)-dependent dehydrogenase (short-subunit alcohol dehydrogenase family)
MNDFAGKTAFVTGAANGIGLGIAKALAGEGANVAIADIDEAGLARAKKELAATGTSVMSLALDVSDRSAVQGAADEVERELGPVDVLVNNAGVTLGPIPVTDIDAAMWDWIFGVNLFGVVNGVATFVPRMLARGNSGHVVNTSSIGGLQVNAELQNGSYSMTKYAVVALSEALQLQLTNSKIGVSVLCPALVRTTLQESAKRRPARFGGPYAEVMHGHELEMPTMQPVELEPDAVGARVIESIRRDEFFIFTHPETRAWIEARHAKLMEGFDALEEYLRDRSSQ